MAIYLSVKNIAYQIFLGLFLAIGNAAPAQELNTVFYDRVHRQEIIKKSGKKKLQSRAAATVAATTAAAMGTAKATETEAQLIYASDHLLFISPQGTDTVLLSKINKTEKDKIYRRQFCITYNNKSDLIGLSFCKRKNAKKFKRFMLENGGQYKRRLVVKVLLFPFIELAKFESLLLDLFHPQLKSKWPDTCQ